jgi:hypothetical protein
MVANTNFQKAVMDVSPWPDGQGFSGGTVWWNYVMTKSERQRLDNLIGMALLDTGVREQLVTKRDDGLLSAFGLSQETKDWLKALKVSSLVELAEAIASAHNRPALVETA